MTYHILVSGKVQGVGFRAFTQRQAKRIGAKGWVRNLNDGRVEVLVSVGEVQFDRFCEALKKGPVFSRVDDIKWNSVHPIEDMSEFRIEVNGEEVWQNQD